ncbi:MAG: hypothetical protein MUC83_19590 [Pirellula sp.]|nr:hypothetical protein [Pirellula sp.]
MIGDTKASKCLAGTIKQLVSDRGIVIRYDNPDRAILQLRRIDEFKFGRLITWF